MGDITDMFGWLDSMKLKHCSIILLIFLVILFEGCENTKKTYYEIPKSEVVDVSSYDKENDISHKNDISKEEQKSNKYFTYNNERFGFSFDIPDYLKPDETSDNDDWICFENTGGDIYVSAYGSYDPSAYYDYPDIDEIYLDELAEMEYTPKFAEKNGNGFELAWEEYNTVYRKKYYLKSDGTENVLIISYPLSKEKECEDDAKRILDSFKTGCGYDSYVNE